VASLAGRRWGPGISGWLVGLPFTSAPIAYFLARDHGLDFAATAAAGTMAGGISQAAFCLAYAWLARHGAWPRALAGACAAFALLTVVLARVTLPALAMAALAFAGLAAAVRLMPVQQRGADARTPRPGWDLPARMVVATAFVLLLTGVAEALGPHLTGLLAPFPLYAAILAVFAHALEGAGGATRVVRGLVLGLFAFAAFFLVLASTLVGAGIGRAFAAAVVVALAVQCVSLAALRRTRVAA
jgi:hypothetical protein